MLNYNLSPLKDNNTNTINNKSIKINNLLESSCINNKKFKNRKQLYVCISITSLESSKQEYSNSQKIINYFKSNEIEFIVFDINQEMVFSYKDKIKEGIRQKFKEQGKLLKINSSISIPQINIGNDLYLDYNQFEIICKTDSNLFKKIICKEICTHIRFYNNRIEYITYNNEFEYCIYCYSERKIRPKFIFLLNKRNSDNKETHLVLSICENNRITLKVIDLDNMEHEFNTIDQSEKSKINSDFNKHYLTLFNNKKTNMFILDNEAFYGLESFGDIIEKKLLFLQDNNAIKNLNCEICENKLEPSLIELRKCINCIYIYSSNNSKSSSFYSLYSDYSSSIKKIYNDDKSSENISDKSKSIVSYNICDSYFYKRKLKLNELYNSNNKGRHKYLTPLADKKNFINKLQLKKFDCVKKLDFTSKHMSCANNSNIYINKNTANAINILSDNNKNTLELDDYSNYAIGSLVNNDVDYTDNFQTKKKLDSNKAINHIYPVSLNANNNQHSNHKSINFLSKKVNNNANCKENLLYQSFGGYRN